jgi:Virulence protein RhuM family
MPRSCISRTKAISISALPSRLLLARRFLKPLAVCTFKSTRHASSRRRRLLSAKHMERLAGDMRAMSRLLQFKLRHYPFFARLQDKFTYAITGQESAEILLERADHTLGNMGLQTMKGECPSAGDAIVAKNYPDRDELYALHIPCEQFLYSSSRGLFAGRPLQWMRCRRSSVNQSARHPVFFDYKLAQKAKNHALQRTRAIQRSGDR